MVAKSVCSGAMRQYLQHHGELPDENLAYVTVTSIRDPESRQVAPRGHTNLQVMTLVPHDYGLWHVDRGPAEGGRYHRDPEVLASALGTRFVLALGLEAAWEVLENSPVIIERYREVTISLGYVGDSVLNSLSDIVMMAIGFALAARVSVRWSIATVVILELGMLLLYRDNLALNVLMLLAPIEAVRTWQMGGQS